MPAKNHAPAVPHPDETTEPDPLLALIGAAVLDPNQQSREAANDVVLRALRATVTQSKAVAACARATRADATNEHHIARLGEAIDDAQRETNAAGAALAKALRGLR